jgi:hypothetical protein
VGLGAEPAHHLRVAPQVALEDVVLLAGERFQQVERHLATLQAGEERGRGDLVVYRLELGTELGDQLPRLGNRVVLLRLLEVLREQRSSDAGHEEEQRHSKGLQFIAVHLWFSFSQLVPGNRDQAARVHRAAPANSAGARPLLPCA